MDKPMCPVCEHRHNSSEAHIWKDGPITSGPAVKLKLSPDLDKMPVHEVAIKGNTVIVKPALPCQFCNDQALKDHLETEKSKRAEYMRNYRSK